MSIAAALRIVFTVLMILGLTSFVLVWAGLLAHAIEAWRSAPAQRLRRGLPVAVAVLVLCVLGMLAINTGVGMHAQSSVVARIRERGPQCEVRVNGSLVSDGAPLIAALEQLRTVASHHSSPTTRFLVQMRCITGALTLLLARDSQIPDEYWVYLPDNDPIMSPPGGQEIGRVTTSALVQQ